jgi:predicted transcriptional regulator
MKLSRTELLIFSQIAHGNKDIPEIARALKKSRAQIYKSGQKLIAKGIILRVDGSYEPVRETHINLLAQIMTRFSAAIEPFSGSGFPVLTALLQPRTITELVQETGLKRTQTFKLLKIAYERSIVKKEKDTYYLNQKLYAEVIEFLQALQKYEELLDKRVPADAMIYFKNQKEIVFSSGEELEATLTAFSAYERYGIKLLMITNYYYLPKKTLGKEEVFKHSLLITEKDMNIHHIIYVALFYAKYKKQISAIRHKILENLDKIFEGERISGYPTLQEIKDRADVYDIRL